MDSTNERTENNLGRTRFSSREKKLQKTIEGWSVGVLGVIALLGTAYASLQYSAW